MSDFLVDHALTNVWCTPDQDRQYIFKPQKISPQQGVFNRVNVLYDSIALPSTNDRYHVYQIGQVPPDLLNVVGDVNTWRPISRVCRERELVIDLYANNGVQFPRFEAWVLITLDKNIIIAVKDIPVLSVSLQTTDLYIRFYSNAYFSSLRNVNDGHPDAIYVSGKMITNTADTMNVQAAFATYKAKIGYTYGFINGHYSDTLLITTIHVGDVVEFVYDSTIYRTFDYVVSDLDTFTSVLDAKQKFLLHSGNFTSQTIEYEDDIDFFLFKRQSGTNAAKGLYFHKNSADAVRSITHIDYSIPTTYVEAYVGVDNIFTTLADVTIRMHVRRSGYQRVLVDEAHRIKELYKLSALDLKNTLLGINSSFTYWNAATLESSQYPRIMRSYEQFITLPMVVNAYGYNAISKIVGDTPALLTIDDAGHRFSVLPAGLQVNSTVYEYDADGVLLGFHVHNSGESHFAVDPLCSYIEAVTGVGGMNSGSYYDVASLILESGVEYRYYKATKSIDGNPDEWSEATLGTDYTITNNTATWILNSSVWFTLIRKDRVFVAYNYYTDVEDPVFRLSINANAVFGGTPDSRPMQVPTGELDLWMNGRSLVEGIDFYINWPEVCIVSKRYVVGGFSDYQKITVRARGFADPDLTYPTVDEVGFVSHGELSRNGLFNVRDDRVMRIVADGRTLMRDAIQFGEDGVMVNSSPINGTPYAIRDLRVFLGSYLPTDYSMPILRSSHNLRMAAKDVDAAIQNYLTLKLPEVDPSGPSIGLSRYELYSPFCARIAIDIMLGNITQEFALTDPTDPQVRVVMAQYEFLLAYDPCVKPDTNFDVVSVHPHPYTTTLPIRFAGFKLLQKVIRIYLHNRISINSFFTVT